MGDAPVACHGKEHTSNYGWRSGGCLVGQSSVAISLCGLAASVSAIPSCRAPRRESVSASRAKRGLGRRVHDAPLSPASAFSRRDATHHPPTFRAGCSSALMEIDTSLSPFVRESGKEQYSSVCSFICPPRDCGGVSA